MSEEKKLLKITKMKGVNKGACKASVSLEIAGVFNLYGLFIMEGSNGLWLSYPSYKGTDGKYYRYIYPLNKEISDTIEKAVIDHYLKTVKKDGTDGISIG